MIEALKPFAELITIILTIGTGLWTMWRPIKKILDRYDTALDEAEKCIEEQVEVNKKQDEKLDQVYTAIEPMQHGIQQILRFRVERDAARIIQNKGATREAKESLYRLHEVYEALGQNGLIGNLYAEAMSQPTIEKQ